MASQLPQDHCNPSSSDTEIITIGDEIGERNTKRARTEHDPQKEELAKAARLARCESEAARLAELMNLEQSLIDQVQSNLAQICNSGANTRDFQLLSATAIYITLRLNSKPYTLMDIADKVPCDLFSLGKVYTRVMIANQNFCFSELDLSLFVEKKSELLAVPPVHQEKIKRLAVRVLNSLKDKDILCGRRRETIAASAIFFAAKALGFKEYDIDKISSTLGVPKSTLSVRVREMKANLMTKAKENIPWVTFPDKDVFRYLDQILDQLEVLSRAVASPAKVVVVADSDSDSEVEFLTKPRRIPKTEPLSPPSSPLISRRASRAPSVTPTTLRPSILTPITTPPATNPTPAPFPRSITPPTIYTSSPPKYPPAPTYPNAKTQKIS